MSDTEMFNWKEMVAKKIFKVFDDLPKQGKPKSDREWTVLAGFVLNHGKHNFNVVSCATGTKCLGKSSLDISGHRVHDSHAEILARRAFQRYLMAEIASFYQDKRSEVLDFNEISRKLSLKPDIKVIFFSTQMPCGDASIFTRPEGDIHPERKRKLDCLIRVDDINGKCAKLNKEKTIKLCAAAHSTEPVSEPPTSQGTLQTPSDCVDLCGTNDIHNTQPDHCFIQGVLEDSDTDLYRTGAKCVPGGAQDKLESGNQYHVTGVLRTKPGRGDATLSHSCSDKIARWNLLGCQGCLTMLFLEKPIYIDHFIIADPAYDGAAILRATHGRLSDCIVPLETGFRINNPALHSINTYFPHSKHSVIHSTLNTGLKVTPSSSSIIWYRSINQTVIEVSVDGYRQGVTKKSLHTPKARLTVCRSNMMMNFQNIIASLDDDSKSHLFHRGEPGDTYQQCKSITEYSAFWDSLSSTDSLLKLWLRKDRKYSQFAVG